MTAPTDTYIPPGGPPQTSPPSPEIYQTMGRDGVYRMLADFYELLGQSEISHMFPSDSAALQMASRKSAAFFVQICGGPQLYTTQFGPPRLRARHLPFKIGDKEKEIWLASFVKILEFAPEKYNFPKQHMEGFVQWLTAFAEWMVNHK